ncbi:MAG: [FeFe] hydrogenase H-cluster radical SAM maturase HydE [Alkalispirochaeta sp.]
MNDTCLEALYTSARKVCTEECGTGVLVRGIVEFSSYCKNSCTYCGLRSQNGSAGRYRLSTQAILSSVGKLYRLGVRTVVLQSGEDPELSADWVSSLVAQIKERWDIAVTLSLGEWPRSSYRQWREAGADRYLLKIETTDIQLYHRLHPGMNYSNRLRCIDDLEELGYQTGSGIIVGLPGQSDASIAKDLQFLYERDFDMISIGPFIPHPRTPLAHYPAGSIERTCTALALIRCLSKNSHLPATSALAATNPDRRHLGLLAGANVIMPNFTPQNHVEHYDIYPHEGRVATPESSPLQKAEYQVRLAGRHMDYAKGDSLKTKAPTGQTGQGSFS